MRAIGAAPRTLVVLGLLAAIGVAGCTASPAPRPVASVLNQPVNPGTAASSRPAVTPSATTTAGAVRNLVVTSAERSELTAVFVAQKGIPLSEVNGGGPMPGSVYYAYDPAADTYWAAANFAPVKGLPLSAVEAFEGSGDIGMFRKVGTGSWQMQTVASGLECLAPRFFPKAVLIAWSLPTTPNCMG
jgi:hypothetical protein